MTPPFRKGMPLREFQELVAPSKRCGCTCNGCAHSGAGTHCLQPPCTRTRNRRSAAVVAAARPKPLAPAKGPAKPKPKPQAKPQPKPAPAESAAETPERMRREWFVTAERGATKVALPARDANAAQDILDNLVRHGWKASAERRDTYRSDPRFAQLPKEVP